ncbi:MAG: SRPBCC family protein [Dehalococcoidia bacterium]
MSTLWRWFRIWAVLKLIAGPIYLFVIRPWGMRWGATDEEIDRPMPGDEILPDRNYDTTKAITIDAPPEAVLPWLVQLGKGRGGLYSIDWLDRLFGFLDAPSAQEILPQYQELHAGDAIPTSPIDWPVQFVDPGRALVLGDRIGEGGWSWAFGLYPMPDGRTRLVSRNRARTPGGVAWWLGMLVIDAAALVMTRQMLINLRDRAERLARA